MLASMTPCFCTTLRIASRKLSADYDAALAPLGINIAQYFLLRTIGGHEALSLTELGRLAELDRSTAGRNVRVLERMELVGTRRSDADQREALVSLTAAGEALLRDAKPLWDACQQAFKRRLGADKLKALNALLADV
jgi:DNA-binding MarR family transcriptional regulator